MNNMHRMTRILRNKANHFHFKALRKFFKALLASKIAKINHPKVPKIRNLYKILSLKNCPVIFRKEMRSLERSNIKNYNKIGKYRIKNELI